MPLYGAVCSSEIEAAAVLAAVDALEGHPKHGTRIGPGHKFAPRAALLASKSVSVKRNDLYSVWTVQVAEHYVSLLDHLVSVALLLEGDALGDLSETGLPKTLVQPDASTWSLLVGFFREYLYDFDPSLHFEVWEIRGEQGDDFIWTFEVGSGSDERTDYTAKVEASGFADYIRSFDQLLGRSAVSVPIGMRTKRSIVAYFLTIDSEIWHRQPQAATGPLRALSTFLAAYVFTLNGYLAREGTLSYDEFSAARLLTVAGRLYMNVLFSSFHPQPRPFHLFDELTRLSQTDYERRVLRGRLLICDPADGRLSLSAKLRQPVPLSDTKRVRKLLEASAKSFVAISDSELVWGFAAMPVAEESYPYYVVDFVDRGQWSLRRPDGGVLMRHANGRAMIPSAKIEFNLFSERFALEFPAASRADAQVVYGLIQGAAQQEHGTTLVVVDDASSEAARLQPGVFQLERPRRLQGPELERLAAMDGALLLDPQGQCHAIAAILDGLAHSTKGDSARGARFNSSIRYIESRKTDGKKTLVIVISEDGNVDLLPRQ